MINLPWHRKKISKFRVCEGAPPESKLNNECEKKIGDSWLQIHNLFSKAVDWSQIETFLYKIKLLENSQTKHSASCVGQGYHFKVYKVSSSTLQLGGERFSIAISVARSCFQSKRRLTNRDYLSLLDRLSLIQNPLVPPTQAFVCPVMDRMVYIQPYCPQPFDSSHCFLPIDLVEDYLKKLVNDLDAVGLAIADSYQLRCLHGHPFLIDWSDLTVV